MNSVFRIAENAAKHYGYTIGGDIVRIVESLGGKIILKNFWAEGSQEAGSLDVIDHNDFTIFIPEDTSEIRDRFTIAHELGHYVLHYLWPLQVKGREKFCLRASRYGSDRPEWEANWFAAAFLMPEDEFKKVAKRKSNSIEQMAKHFAVSLKAAETRAKVLEIELKP
ncbi:ImmA/IrrE family metallo-endopeptidase [Robiginitomaculum antarcticum]|uniref:ImmA/IrrE family metallo-endopeptidase n=1 Tax=Robiginitomaculum antarcticum TaxID=437507 RepID=UPI00035F6367|nr:ImmA/IrrE family metallo-endopeptidase [Robiginitomaculum antarcticum]